MGKLQKHKERLDSDVPHIERAACRHIHLLRRGMYAEFVWTCDDGGRHRNTLCGRHSTRRHIHIVKSCVFWKASIDFEAKLEDDKGKPI